MRRERSLPSWILSRLGWIAAALAILLLAWRWFYNPEALLTGTIAKKPGQTGAERTLIYCPQIRLGNPDRLFGLSSDAASGSRCRRASTKAEGRMAHPSSKPKTRTSGGQAARALGRRASPARPARPLRSNHAVAGSGTGTTLK